MEQPLGQGDYEHDGCVTERAPKDVGKETCRAELVAERGLLKQDNDLGDHQRTDQRRVENRDLHVIFLQQELLE